MFLKTMGNERIWASLDPFLESGPILGRIQANVGFLKGLLSLDPYDSYRFYPASEAAGRDLSEALQTLRPDLWDSGRLRVLRRVDLPAALSQTDHHVFHLSDCIVNPAFLAAVRNARSRQIFPITSVTHSLSYARYGLDFLKHLSPCVTPRDVVVATSRTAADVVRGFYGSLRQGYGLSPAAFPEPSVEIIPLGVDLGQHAWPTESRRSEARERLGFGPETVFLVLARLCQSSKMDFPPVLRAFHRLSQGGFPVGGVRLVLAGWNEEADWGRRTLMDLATNIGLPLTVVERPSEALKNDLYAASDVFLSPSDNLQESFGLTLLEAQAMGLPVIASDFDGYRDLVEHGRTGLLLPTTGPSLTDAVDLLAPMGFDNHTQLLLAQRLAVDVAAMAGAIELMATDAVRRRDMGLAARRKAEGYAWEEIAGRHVELWERLWEREVPENPASRHPVAVPYARIFKSYPTDLAGAGVTVTASRLGDAIYRGRDYPVVHAGLAGVIDVETVRALLVLARKPRDCDALAAALRDAVPGLGAEEAQAHILWCLKQDILERTPSPDLRLPEGFHG
jgi:glycosyltransferase involved in cell wall biosynthesis